MDDSKSALVVIDAQRDFLDEEGPYARRHKGIASMRHTAMRIAMLLKQPPVPVVAVIAHYRPDQFAEGLSLCIRDTSGVEPALELPKDLPTFVKHEHSAFSSAPFLQYLADQQIKRLFLAGFLIEYCVRATALDALAAGFAVVIVEDLVDTADDVQQRKEKTITELRGAGIASCISIDVPVASL
ncbi:cysteine hydrolase family protein [Leptonema illini]|uniref:Isochorismatase hydrolase n=1 Tax=Leptonema illini DSM 21528 TaxID=929563 RepID=H2CI06_9LEPT|nr:isochorismatase family cysteine hydrolase [Leptonema illini]EHQ08029.1 isochorismatase hydrolase [Leptonema illini DSM 21528]